MSDAPTDPAPNGDSKVFGVSIRAWLALMFSTAVCLICVAGEAIAMWVGIKTNAFPQVEVREPLYSMFVGAVCFYFGSKTKTG